MNSAESAPLDPVGNGVICEPELSQLRSRDHLMLARGRAVQAARDAISVRGDAHSRHEEPTLRFRPLYLLMLPFVLLRAVHALRDAELDGARRGRVEPHEVPEEAAGHHRALAALVCVEPLADHLVGLDRAGHHLAAGLVVAGDLLPLGRDGARVDREHLDAGSLQLGVQRVAEVQREGLGGTVGRLVWERLHAGGRGDGDDAAASPLDHRGDEHPGEDHDGLAVDPDHLGLALDGKVGEAAAEAEAGVVDEQVDLDTELVDLALQLPRVDSQVVDDHVGGDRQGVRERLEAVGATGDQDELVAPLGELPGELLADPRRGARDECCLGHGLTLPGLVGGRRGHRIAARSHDEFGR